MTSAQKSIYKCPECGLALSDPLVKDSNLPTGLDFLSQFLALAVATALEVVLHLFGLSLEWSVGWSVVCFCLVLVLLPRLRQLSTYHCPNCHARGPYSSLSRESAARGDA